MMGGMAGSGNWTRSSQAGDIDEDGKKLYDNRVVVRLAAYGLPYRRQIALSLLGVLIYTLMTIAIPLLIALGIRSATNGEGFALDMIGYVFIAPGGPLPGEFQPPVHPGNR
jgi:hypothetical protein